MRQGLGHLNDYDNCLVQKKSSSGQDSRCDSSHSSSDAKEFETEEVVTPAMQRLLRDLRQGRRASLAEGITLGG